MPKRVESFHSDHHELNVALQMSFCWLNQYSLWINSTCDLFSVKEIILMFFFIYFRNQVAFSILLLNASLINESTAWSFYCFSLTIWIKTHCSMCDSIKDQNPKHSFIRKQTQNHSFNSKQKHHTDYRLGK